MSPTLIFSLVVLFFVVVIPIGIYNGLVSRRNAVDNSFASLDANLQKRFDLVPNLVAAVKGYMGHERETLEELTRLRSQGQSGSPGERLEADGQISQALRHVMFTAENYPQLRASENFNQLQRTLVELEEQISASRRSFNAAVTDYNTSIQAFPGSVFASMFGFAHRDLFAITNDAARVAPNLTGQF